MGRNSYHIKKKISELTMLLIKKKNSHDFLKMKEKEKEKLWC
jgi:hypothetical protein